MRSRVGFRLVPALVGLGLTLCCLLLGGVVGLATVALHQTWGLLVLAVAACLAVLVAMPRAWWSRPAFVVGFGLVVLRSVLPRPEGDFLVASDPAGFALLGLTLGLVVAGVATAPRPAPRPGSRASSRSGPREGASVPDVS